MSFIEALIQLPYSRPGDDLTECLIEDEQEVNVKATLAKMIALLKTSVRKLEHIHDLIPKDNTLDIYGSGQNIGMCGDNEVLEKLLKKGLIIEGVYEESEGENDDELDELDEIDDDEGEESEESDECDDFYE